MRLGHDHRGPDRRTPSRGSGEIAAPRAAANAGVWPRRSPAASWRSMRWRRSSWWPACSTSTVQARVDRGRSRIAEDPRGDDGGGAVGEGAVIDNGFDAPILSRRTSLGRWCAGLSQPAHVRTRLFILRRPVRGRQSRGGSRRHGAGRGPATAGNGLAARAGARRLRLPAAAIGGFAGRDVPLSGRSCSRAPRTIPKC